MRAQSCVCRETQHSGQSATLLSGVPCKPPSLGQVAAKAPVGVGCQAVHGRHRGHFANCRLQLVTGARIPRAIALLPEFEAFALIIPGGIPIEVFQRACIMAVQAIIAECIIGIMTAADPNSSALYPKVGACLKNHGPDGFVLRL